MAIILSEANKDLVNSVNSTELRKIAKENKSKKRRRNFNKGQKKCNDNLPNCSVECLRTLETNKLKIKIQNKEQNSNSKKINKKKTFNE